MKLEEMLASPEVKAMYKELVKKYHPDVGGDQEVMKRVNNAKDKGDDEIIDLYNQLVMGGKFEKAKEPKYSDMGLGEVKKDLSKYSAWAKEISKELYISLKRHFLIVVRAEQPRTGKWDLRADCLEYGKGNKVVNRFSIFNIQKFSTQSQFKESITNKI